MKLSELTDEEIKIIELVRMSKKSESQQKNKHKAFGEPEGTEDSEVYYLQGKSKIPLYFMNFNSNRELLETIEEELSNVVDTFTKNNCMLLTFKEKEEAIELCLKNISTKLNKYGFEKIPVNTFFEYDSESNGWSVPDFDITDDDDPKDKISKNLKNVVKLGRSEIVL